MINITLIVLGIRCIRLRTQIPGRCRKEQQQSQYLGPPEKEEDVRWALLVGGIILVGAILVGVLQKIIGLF